MISWSSQLSKWTILSVDMHIASITVQIPGQSVDDVNTGNVSVNRVHNTSPYLLRLVNSEQMSDYTSAALLFTIVLLFHSFHNQHWLSSGRREITYSLQGEARFSSVYLSR